MTDKVKPRDIYVPPEKLLDKIGILDPEGKNLNPLNGKKYSNAYKNNINNSGKGVKEIYAPLTLYQNIEETIVGIYNHNPVICRAPTGSGKTVILPKASLAVLNYNGRIAMTNPKKIPSISAATFAAQTLDVELGKEVGYLYKGSPTGSYSPEETKLLFCTDGYIKAMMLGSDPLLESYDMIILDEVHERNTNIDILLLLLRRAILKRPTLRLILVSATIDENIYKNYFPDSHFNIGVLNPGGSTTYPIKLFHIQRPINTFSKGEVSGEKFIDAAVRRACDILLSTDSGDILVFLTGSVDIKKGVEKIHILLKSLSENINNETFCVTLSGGVGPLHEKLVTDQFYYQKNQSDAQQFDKFASGPFKRKVVFSTEVAESSITINGLKYVVDCGLSKQSKYYANKNMDALEKKYIAKSNHLQRRGRVGRTSPGECHCIFTKDEYAKLFQDYPPPPLTISNITTTILDFMQLDQYISHIELPVNIKPEKINLDKLVEDERVTLNEFFKELLDIPDMDNVQQGIIRLYYTGMIVINGNNALLSPLGKAMGNIRINSIELRRAMISAYNYKCFNEVCAITSMIEGLGSKILDLFTTRDLDEITRLWHIETGEFILLLDIFSEFVLREYDQVTYENGKKIKIHKIGGTKSWCKKFKINYDKMVNIYALYLENQRSVQNVINDQLQLHLERDVTNTEENFLLFTDKPPIIYPDVRLNVIRALVDGYFINIMKQNANMTYTTCFPSLVRGSLDKRQSLFIHMDKEQSYKYCFYNIYASVSMTKTFNIVNGIPKILIKDIIEDDNIYNIFKNCLTI
jgi:HrpA-like RNA helicase